MKREVTPDTLASCLDEIENGTATIDECVAAHPEVGDDLRSLLEIACAIPPLPSAGPDPAFRARARAELLIAISREPQAVTTAAFVRLFRRLLESIGRPPELSLGRLGMPAIIVVIVLALTAAAGGGAAFASQDSIPGDALYQVKASLESLQLALASSDEAKAQTYLELADKRLHEVEKASRSGKDAAAAKAAEDLVRELERLDYHLDRAAISGKSIAQLAARMVENLERQQEALASAEERASDKAKPSLKKAAEKARTGLETARSHLKRSRIADEDENETATPTATPLTGEPTGTATPLPTASATALPSFTAIASDVRGLEDDENVPGQSYKGLLAKLKAAEEAVERGQTDVALRVLNAFLNQLEAAHRSGHISEENYRKLYEEHGELMRSLNSSTPEAKKTKRNDYRQGDEKSPDSKIEPEPTETPENAVRRSPTPTMIGERDDEDHPSVTPTPAPMRSPSATPQPSGATPTPHPGQKRESEVDRDDDRSMGKRRD